MGTWTRAELRPTALDRWAERPRVRADELIGREVVARVAYGFNARGGGMFKAHNVRGQVWSAADPTMIGSRRERAYWIADGSHYYAVSASELIDQCGFEVPSMVTGGQTDTPCIEAPVTVLSDGTAACASCEEAGS